MGRSSRTWGRHHVDTGRLYPLPSPPSRSCPLRLVLLQCELQHRHQAPHLAGALFATDLRAAGHEVGCTLVHPSALDEVTARYGDADLLLLDSVFPFAMQRRLRESTGKRILVGGHNALQHVLRGPADYALVGPARSTLLTAVDAIDRGEPGRAPGLWFRRADGALDCGPPAPDRRPADEVLPFTPDFSGWDYLGPPRLEGSNLRVPSVVAELGCVWNRSAMGGEGVFADVAPRMPVTEMTALASAELTRTFVRREGGCTFCTFRYQPRRGHRADRAIALVLEQIRVLVALGARGVSLQTEHPLPLLAGILDRLKQTGLAPQLDELHVRTIPWLVIRHRTDLEASIARCRDLGIKLVLGQIGFEAFDARSLAVFNKGLTAAENESAARLLTELHHAHCPHFEGIHGHGLIPLHPWSAPEDVRTNVAALRRSAPWLLPSMQPFARVELYNEWNPLFWKLEDEGLLVKDPEGFGWGWRYADTRMEELTRASASILAGNRTLEAATVMDEVARLILETQDPTERRAAYLAMRGSRAPDPRTEDRDPEH